MKYLKNYSTRKAINYTIAIIFIIFGSALTILVNIHMKKQAVFEAGEKARLITDFSLSVHTYYSHDLKPAVFSISNKTSKSNYFDPKWMSSTYAVREIHKYLNGLNKTGYYYKECAINARNPENEADYLEREYILKLNKGETHNLTVVREDNEIPYLQVLRKGETMESSCLRCHDKPGNAPSEMTALYGDTRSFDREEGEVVSAISLKIPLSTAYGRADYFSMILSSILLALLFLSVTIILIINKTFVFSPLERLKNMAVAITKNRDELGKSISPEGGLEMIELTGAFNSLSFELKDVLDNMEERIREKTREIENTNEKLKLALNEKEIILKEVHHRIKNNMSVVSGLLMIQADTLDNPAAVEVLEDARGRIDSMMTIYDKLYRTANYGDVYASSYISELVEDIARNFANHQNISIVKKIEEFSIDQETLVPLCIIINEVITNSFKHAFPGNRKGIIEIETLHSENKTITLSIADNGIGFTKTVTTGEESSFGMELIELLAEQIGGESSFASSNGSRFTITFTI